MLCVWNSIPRTTAGFAGRPVLTSTRNPTIKATKYIGIAKY